MAVNVVANLVAASIVYLVAVVGGYLAANPGPILLAMMIVILAMGGYGAGAMLFGGRHGPQIMGTSMIALVVLVGVLIAILPSVGVLIAVLPSG